MGHEGFDCGVCETSKWATRCLQFGFNLTSTGHFGKTGTSFRLLLLRAAVSLRPLHSRYHSCTANYGICIILIDIALLTHPECLRCIYQVRYRAQIFSFHHAAASRFLPNTSVACTTLRPSLYSRTMHDTSNTATIAQITHSGASSITCIRDISTIPLCADIASRRETVLFACSSRFY